MEKRGLSPVIATVMLIALALIIALIIFLWAKNFIKEVPQKFGEPVDRACAQVSIDAEITGDIERKISLINRGNVPVYGVEIRKKDAVEGSIKNIATLPTTIKNGETGEATIAGDGSDVSGEVIVYPILLGESKSGQNKRPYTCGEQYGVPLTI
ncbi:hypothetical protein KW787_00315 [Candidatus Pacearchaeota archaeon]|nr:hypothetical protein [Candidatus Pacearchaeota archaeon]